MGDTPDLVTSHKAEAARGLGEEKSKELMAMLKQSTRSGGKRIVIREDPHRRCYKRLVALAFLGGTLLYLVLDLAFQIQSVSGSQYFCCCKIFFRHPRRFVPYFFLLPPPEACAVFSAFRVAFKVVCLFLRLSVHRPREPKSNAF